MTRDYEKNNCKIRTCEKAYDVYAIKSCDQKFSVGSMAREFTANKFEEIEKWIDKNAKHFNNLYVEGYFVK